MVVIDKQFAAEIVSKLEARPKILSAAVVGKTIAYDVVHDVIVIVIQETPSTAEWTRYCDFCFERKAKTKGVVVYGTGGHPTASQRAQIQKRLGAPPLLALFTDNAMAHMVQGIVRVMPGYETRMQIFEPDQEHAALKDHLKLPLDERMAVVIQRRVLEQKLSQAADKGKAA